jgi:hypothetical protein
MCPIQETKDYVPLASTTQSVKLVRKKRCSQAMKQAHLVLRAAAYMRTTLDNLLGSLILVLLKVLHE